MERRREIKDGSYKEEKNDVFKNMKLRIDLVS